MRRPRKSQTLLDKIRWPVSLIVARLQYPVVTYVRVMATPRPQDDPYLRPWKVAKDATWLSFLVLMYLQYYFMDVFLQIAMLPVLDVRVP